MGGLPGGGGPGGGPPDPLCNTPKCQSALASVVTAKKQVITQCAAVETLKGNYIALLVGAIAALLAAIGLLVGAAVSLSFGNILAGVICFVLAAALLLLFAILLANEIVAKQQFDAQLAVLNTDRSSLNSAMNSVRASCPELCWGDLSTPACPD